MSENKTKLEKVEGGKGNPAIEQEAEKNKAPVEMNFIILYNNGAVQGYEKINDYMINLLTIRTIVVIFDVKNRIVYGLSEKGEMIKTSIGMVPNVK